MAFFQEHRDQQIIIQLQENQEIITQNNTAIQQLINESIQLRKKHLEKVIQFEQSARLKDDEYNKMLRQNEILISQNIQIQNESDTALRQDVTNTTNILMVKEVELTQLRQSWTTLFETLQEIQNHDEIQMLELEKSQRSFDDLERINLVLHQKLNEQSSSQSYFNNSFESLECQNSQQNIYLNQLNRDIEILNNQIKKINQENLNQKQENITLKVQINSQQQQILNEFQQKQIQDEIQLIEIEKSKRSFNDLERINQVLLQKLNAEVCQGKNDKNIQNLQCFLIQLNKDLLAKDAQLESLKIQIREITEDHLILNDENSILKVQINQLKQSNSDLNKQLINQCVFTHNRKDSQQSYEFQHLIPPVQQFMMGPPLRSQGQQVELDSQSIIIPDEDDIIFDSQQQQAHIPPNIIVEHNDSQYSYEFVSSRQIIAPLQQFMMDPPFRSQGQQVELDTLSIVIPDDEDIIFDSQQQSVPLRPNNYMQLNRQRSNMITRIPRQQNRNPVIMYIKLVKKIKRNFPN